MVRCAIEIDHRRLTHSAPQYLRKFPSANGIVHIFVCLVFGTNVERNMAVAKTEQLRWACDSSVTLSVVVLISFCSFVCAEPQQNYCCSRTCIYHLVVSILTYACFLWVDARAHTHHLDFIEIFASSPRNGHIQFLNTHFHNTSNKRRVWIIYFLRQRRRRYFDVCVWGTEALCHRSLVLQFE